jgi:hypothetical protein
MDGPEPIDGERGATILGPRRARDSVREHPAGLRGRPLHLLPLAVSGVVVAVAALVFRDLA